MKTLRKKDIVEVAFGFADEGKRKMIEASKVREVFVDDLIDVIPKNIILSKIDELWLNRIIRQKAKVLEEKK